MVWVYRITCAVTGKFYIGITQRDPRRRWQGHVRDAMVKRSNTAIAKAIRKYGPDAFLFEPIFAAFDRTAANAAEIHFIREYGSLAPGGYNLTTGGDFAPTRTGATHTAETRAKMSAASKGKKKSAEHCATMSAMRRGKKISAAHVEALRRGRMAKNTPFSPRRILEARIRRREEAIRNGSCYVECCNGKGLWRARISLDGVTVHLGLFDTKYDAEFAYRKAAQEHLASLKQELAQLLAGLTDELQPSRSSAVEVPRRDRAETLRELWADPAKRADQIHRIKEGRKRRHQKTLPPKFMKSQPPPP